MTTPLNISSPNTMGAITSGPAMSGGGTVVFGSGSPGATAALSNLTSNPILLIGVAVVGLVGLWIWKRR